MFGCTKHADVRSEGECGHCGLPHCGECLVSPFGAKRPPMCVTCALGFAGVRYKDRRPRVQRRMWRKRDRVAAPATATVLPDGATERDAVAS
jgi:hypothetical protein